MDWLHKMKRACVALSSRFRPRKSGGGGGRGGCCNGDYGLLKLRDAVQMCPYQDVQVMWNMLSESLQPNLQMSSAKSMAQSVERSKQRRPSWRVLFGSNHRDASPSSSSLFR